MRTPGEWQRSGDLIAGLLVLGVLLQGADKAWLQEMAQLPLEDLEARRDKCLEEVG